MRSVTFFLALAVFAAPAAAQGKRKNAKVPAAAEVIRDCKVQLAKAKIGTDRIGGGDAVLCAWKPGTPKIRLIQVRGGVSRTKGFDVTLLRANGVNSEYRVDAPDGYVVMGIRTNVRKKWKKKSRSTPAVYVPYGPHLETKGLLAAGRKYLLGLTDRAAARLDKRKVMSVVDADALVTEVVPERILVTLLVIEHIDPDDFDARGAEAAVDRVFALVGANKEDAYDYAVSEAGAGGLAQFIRETYKLTRQRYPRAKLIEGFVEGMRDHENAVMAQYCLADWSLSLLSEDERKALSKDEEDLGAWIAAAYNGGEKRAAKALRDFPGDWEKRGHGLAGATTVYVREFRMVYRHLWGP